MLRTVDTLKWLGLSLCFSVCVPSCGKKPTLPALPDQMSTRTRNTNLVVAINGIPMGLYEESGGSFEAISQLEKSGTNKVTIVGDEADRTTGGNARIRLHPYGHEEKAFVELQLEFEPGEKQKSQSKDFVATNPAWIFGDVAEIKTFTPEDESAILKQVRGYLTAFEHRDVDAILAFNDFQNSLGAKTLKLDVNDLREEQRGILRRMLQDGGKIEVQRVESLEIINFDRGVIVLSKDRSPILKWAGSAGDLVMKSLVFCKGNSGWVAIK